MFSFPLLLHLCRGLFWPDKPMAGGKYNMKYYTGINIVGWSTNVGPLGEAWGSFGKVGGIIYMFFIGFIYSWNICIDFYEFPESPAAISLDTGTLLPGKLFSGE